MLVEAITTKDIPSIFKLYITRSPFLIYKEARFSPANFDFVYSENRDNIVKAFFFKPERRSFLNFGLTNEERAVKFKRNIKETCRLNYFKPRSEHGLTVYQCM